MNNKKIIILILLLGVLYKLALTGDGRFLFNMDNARDMVDVREMIVLGKLRLTGPTSAIEGLYNGPFWYYLLAIPFVLSGGDPYASIVMEIVLWAIGGYFLLKLVSEWNKLLVFPIGALWIASDYISLTTQYAFNPNPVTLLTPLFIYLLVEYLKKGKGILLILAFLLGGLFFNFEMNFGIFMPLIILAALIISKKKFLKDKNFWIGVLVFLLILLPQLLFDLKHQFIMSKAVMSFLTEGKGGEFNPFLRIQGICDLFYKTFQATMMNEKILTLGILFLSIPVFKKFKILKSKDLILLVSSLYILIPFIGYLILPVSATPWHVGGPMAASIILIGFILLGLWRYNFFGKIFSLGIIFYIFYFALGNILNFFLFERSRNNLDASLYKNEISAIDYVYKHAEGKNFKVYTYLPSVYDYPYQYLFWWYGNKKYGYVPGEYVYSPNKPRYISNQEKFQGKKDNLSGLVFLIKEPDVIKMRQAWENDYKDMEFISKETLGKIEVEIRKEVTKQ